MEPARSRETTAWWRDRALIAATFVFVVLTVVVAAGGSDTVDRRVMDTMGGLHDDALTVVAQVVTWLGGLGGMVTIGVLTAAWLIARGERRTAVYVALTLAVGALVIVLVKVGMDRHRPDVFAWLSLPAGQSFPSGHATSVALTFPLVGSLVARRTRPRVSIAVLVAAMVVTLVVAVGLSRMYLGVHWPSDVIAGWALGLGLWRLAMRLEPSNVTTRGPGP